MPAPLPKLPNCQVLVDECDGHEFDVRLANTEVLVCGEDILSEQSAQVSAFVVAEGDDDGLSGKRGEGLFRAVLISEGDAGAGPSLLAGQGSALAMVEAYELAAELQRAGGDHVAAFAGYHRRLAPLVLAKQNAAVGLGAVLAPHNRAQLLQRNTVMRTMTVHAISRLVMRRSLRDPIELFPLP